MSSHLQISHYERSSSFRRAYQDWRNEEFRLSYYDVVRLLEQQDKAISMMESIRSDAFSEAIDVAVEVYNFLDDCLSTFPISDRPTPQSAVKAQQVFDTPELMENILRDLTFKDLIGAQWVNRAMAAAVPASQTLQRVLMLRPVVDGLWYNPFDEWRGGFQGFHCSSQAEHNGDLGGFWHRDYHYTKSDGEETEPGADEIGIEAYFTQERAAQLCIGTTCRRMLICQPAPTEMTVHLNCCKHPHSAWKPYDKEHNAPDQPAVVRRSTGLTIGDLFQATLDLQVAHRNCPNITLRDFETSWAEDRRRQGQHAPHSLIDVRFRAIVRLREDDPHLQKCKNNQDRYSDDNYPRSETSEDRANRERDRKRAARLTAWIAARQDAFRNGAPMPDLAAYTDPVLEKEGAENEEVISSEHGEGSDAGSVAAKEVAVSEHGLT